MFFHDQHAPEQYLRFPRTQRQAGWDDDAEWEGKNDGSGIVGILGGALAGLFILAVVAGAAKAYL